ncbi:calcium-binding protein [Aliarcobacter cryaerophilus]|uniref:calcium-binding protein n=1 Tax=Aliarcobacter cryaerophilus TaxID=28198 RepID=UPI00082D53E0|nr:calcium-binding protein [Aliarcobacter cryaerophilus]
MNPINIYYTSTPTSSKITLIFPSPLGTITEPTILKADGTTINISNMQTTGNIVEIDILQVLSFEDSISILSDKNFSSSTKAQYFIGGKGPNQIDANSLVNLDFKENIFVFANEADDNITLSKYYASTAYAGDGKDTITVNNPNTTLYLSEDIRKQDTIIFPSSSTNESGITKIIDFDLTGSKKLALQNDILSLPSTTIAKNTKKDVNGIDVGTIKSHTIKDGVVTFLSNDITNQEIYQDAIDYLNLNLNQNETVLFNTNIANYHTGVTVFQKGTSVYDSKTIQLEGLSNITLGKKAGQNILTLTDKMPPEISSSSYTKKSLSLNFTEAISKLNYPKNSIKITKNDTETISKFTAKTSKNSIIFSEKKANYKTADFFQINFDKDTNIVDKQKNISYFASYKEDIVYTFVIGSEDSFTKSYSSHENPLQIFGNKNNDSITGSAFDDIIYGGNGADILKGGAGNDTLDGGAGDDTLDGGAGENVLIGGAGNDTYIVNNKNDIVVELAINSGVDTVIVNISEYTVPDNIEEIYIGTKDIIIKGNKQDNIFYSSENDDNIDAKDGNNTISYKDAKKGVDVNLSLKDQQDTLMGKDTLKNFKNLIASDFDDKLEGEQGVANNLTGLKGKDTFFINDSLDTITDFNKFEDKIVLDNTIFTDITKVTFVDQMLKYDGANIATLTGVNTLVVADVVTLA